MATIKERVLARSDLASAYAARDLDALTNGLNAQPETACQETFVTARAVLTRCASGPQIIAALDANTGTNILVKYAVEFLKQGAGIDIGDPAAQTMLDSLVPGILTADYASQLKALSLKPVLVNRAQVEAALYNPDGSEK